MTHTRKFGMAVKKIYSRFFRNQLCDDCKHKLDKKMGMISRIKHKIKHAKHHKKRKLSKGVHIVTLSNGARRKVKVLASGKWKFM